MRTAAQNLRQGTRTIRIRTFPLSRCLFRVFLNLSLWQSHESKRGTRVRQCVDHVSRQSGFSLCPFTTPQPQSAVHNLSEGELIFPSKTTEPFRNESVRSKDMRHHHHRNMYNCHMILPIKGPIGTNGDPYMHHPNTHTLYLSTPFFRPFTPLLGRVRVGAQSGHTPNTKQHLAQWIQDRFQCEQKRKREERRI